jgi:hypothetical protein
MLVARCGLVRVLAEDRRPGPLAQRLPAGLSRETDAPELAADSAPNNAFAYGNDSTERGRPLVAHIRRVNPRDAIGPPPTPACTVCFAG